MEDLFYIYTKNKDLIRLDHGIDLDESDINQGFVDYYDYDILRNVEKEDIPDIIWKDSNAEKCFDEYEGADGGQWMIDKAEDKRLQLGDENVLATDFLNTMMDDFPTDGQWQKDEILLFNEDEELINGDPEEERE